MANTAAVLASVKNRLGITTNTFDTVLTDFIGNAVLRLYPRAALEVDKQEVSSLTVDSYGECEIDISALPTPIMAARRVEAYDGSTWYRINHTYHHGKTLRLRGLNSSVTKIRLYGVKNFTDITTVYDWMLQAVYWYAMSEFYDYLAGNQSRYNSYIQQTGARAVDNMRDESIYYDQKADAYLDQQKQVYGG